MAFTEKSLHFLEENHQRNDKAWFEAHRSDYADYVQTPMRALAEALLPVIVQIDPRLERDPKRTLSRIYRDTRFSRDKSLFKRGSWLVFQLGKGMAGPIWFFEFAPDFYWYGCGYYSAPPRVMARIRQLVLDGDERYLKAQQALDGQPLITLTGDFYKRSRYQDATPEKREWLERRNIVAMHRSHMVNEIFSRKLAETIGDVFLDIAPVYDFLVYADETA